MDVIFSQFIKRFENDPLTTVFTIFVIILIILAVWLYRHYTKESRNPDLLDYNGYYKITLTPTGYRITDGGNLFRTLTTFYYLKKDPFDTEVIIDTIDAENGKKYRARAVVTAVLAVEMVDSVCRHYFGAGGSSANSGAVMQLATQKSDKISAEALLNSYQKKENSNIDELFMQAINSNTAHNSSYGAYKRSSKSNRKTNCDAEIEMDLIIAFTSELKKLVAEKAGVSTEEEIKKAFSTKAMFSAISFGHTVTAIPAFDIVEITE